MADSVQSLVAWFGGSNVLGRPVRSAADLHNAVRAGLPVRSLKVALANLGVTLAEMAAALGWPSRTMARRVSAGRRLRANESDKVVRLARVASLAERTLGSREKASRWMRKPNRALGSEIPMKLLDTDIGAREVEAVLGRIREGVYS